MSHDNLTEHLSKITTHWTVLREAHGEGPGAEAAREVILRRYRGAAYRYLLKLVGDATTADDLTQEFALDLIRGALRRADPERGRFRDYARTALFHLVCRYRKQKKKSPQPLLDEPEWNESVLPPEFEKEFDKGWRDELLARTWAALGEQRQDWFAVLRYRADHPELDSAALATALGERLDKSFTAAGVRQTLKRARELFADLLLDSVAESLEQPTLESVTDELQELDLLQYCRAAIERRADE